MERLFQWTEDLDVGGESLNDDHKNLIKILNKFYKACSDGNSDQSVEETADDLLFYTIYHFRREEELMKEHDYPHLEPHIAKHETFTQKVVEIKTQLEEKTNDPCNSVLRLLIEWLMDHITIEDKKLAPFLATKGVT